MTKKPGLLEQFESLEIAAPHFHHEDHVRVAFEMLETYDFMDACRRYANTIQAMAENDGAPEKFNITITFAFMSLIAERKTKHSQTSTSAFIANNPDLLDRTFLSDWYSTDRLTSSQARHQFLLPDRGRNRTGRSAKN